MAFKDPKAIAQAGVEKGQQKARLSWDKAIVAGFLAGAYIAFGGLLAAASRGLSGGRASPGHQSTRGRRDPRCQTACRCP